MPLILEQLKQTLSALQRSISALKALKDTSGKQQKDLIEAVEAGIIQHFEISYELSWKLMKRWIEEKGTVTLVDGLSRRELYRVAEELQIITSFEEWMMFHAGRNSSSHLYDSQTASEVLSMSHKFLPAGIALLTFLEEHND
jgi:nucleotidyltransferase substrate binding protein (TIGR01987 family)